MQAVAIRDEWFEGAVSLEHGGGWVRPWRLPFEDRALFITPGDTLSARAEESSGVRLRVATDSRRIGLEFLPLPTEPAGPTHALDVTCEGELLVSAAVPDRGTRARFEDLPAGDKVLEIWLPEDTPIELKGMSVDDGATCRTAVDDRPRWVTYGSSLTHCRRAHSPARTWPAIVARKGGLHLTCLGYGGNCCLDPVVGMMIRDLPADLVTLKLGINCSSGALAPRTFGAAVMGLVLTIREKKPETPLGLISPMGYPPNETTPNCVGNTIQQMRADIQEVHARLTARGDQNLYTFNGLDLFSLAEIAEYTEDQCHPAGDGIELMAEHFLERILPKIPYGCSGVPSLHH